ncbi:kinesin-like protein KIN-14B [Tanacetum coccineum]
MIASEAEAKVAPLINEKKRLYDELLTAKGNIKVFCRTRPLFEDEGPSVVEFPDDFTIRVNTGDDTVSNPKKDKNLTRVYGPQIWTRIITIHIYYDNLITGENLYSKLSLVDLAGSESLGLEDNNGDQTTDMLHVMKSLSALGDVLASLTMKKEDVPYGNSVLTKALADSLGGSSKTLLIVNICPDVSNLSETLSALNFSARAGNTILSLGNRDTIKKWKDVANDARKEFYEKEKETLDLKQEVVGLKQELKVANDQCVLLFNEVQKAWKVSFTLQSDLKAENIMLAEKHKVEQDQNNELRTQVAPLLQQVQEHKLQLQQRDSTVESLQEKLKSIEAQLNAALQSSENMSKISSDSTGESTDSAAVTKKLEEELQKRDALIERLHEENEKLFERLTEKASSMGSQQALGAPPKNLNQSPDIGSNNKERALDVVPFSAEKKTDGTLALVKPGQDKIKSTPAGEYLTSALNDFDLEQYDGLAAISDGANKLLMLVLAAVIKAGASREHEILAEIRDAVFAFIRKMEPHRVMDTMLVSRVRILYIRSLLARSPELQSIKVSSVERFLEKPTAGHSRSSSRSSSPGRSPVRYDPTIKNALIAEGQMHGFRVNLKPEKKSKLSSVVLKIRGIDQESWRQHVTGAKLREITDDAKAFATGNRALAALFVHTPAGELQRQIRSWLAMNFDFLSVTGADAVGGVTGQLELLSTAIMDGWMAGLGAAMPPITDALGQLLAEYAKRVYNSQLQHLKDIAGTLATEAAEDSSQVAKLRSALESIDHKRRKVICILTLEDGWFTYPQSSSAAVRMPPHLVFDAALDGILKQIKEIMRQSSVNLMSRSKKRALVSAIDDLSAQNLCVPLLEVWFSSNCSGRGHIAGREPGWIDGKMYTLVNLMLRALWVGRPRVDRCDNSFMRPTVLESMSLEEIKEVFSKLPEALSLLALARTADGTRARYSRLYRTLAMKVPALRELVGELEKGGGLKDVKS